MKISRFCFLLLLVCGFFASCSNNNVLKVIVVTGERSIDAEAFFAMFEAFEGITYEELQHPEVRDLMGTEKMPQFDAIVFYDMPANIELTPVQKENFRSFFSSGVPVVFLHHSILSYQSWDEFQNIIGGKYFEKETEVNGEMIISGYKHDVNYVVEIADKAHPVTRNISDFEIFDEVYSNYVVNQNVTPLLYTSHPESGRIIAWVNPYGNSDIVYIMSGHGDNAFNNTNYSELLLNAIHWVAQKHN